MVMGSDYPHVIGDISRSVTSILELRNLPGGERGKFWRQREEDVKIVSLSNQRINPRIPETLLSSAGVQVEGNQTRKEIV